jgi:hypothetical protein
MGSLRPQDTRVIVAHGAARTETQTSVTRCRILKAGSRVVQKTRRSGARILGGVVIGCPSAGTTLKLEYSHSSGFDLKKLMQGSKQFWMRSRQ